MYFVYNNLSKRTKVSKFYPLKYQKRDGHCRLTHALYKGLLRSYSKSMVMKEWGGTLKHRFIKDENHILPTGLNEIAGILHMRHYKVTPPFVHSYQNRERGEFINQACDIGRYTFDEHIMKAYMLETTGTAEDPFLQNPEDALILYGSSFLKLHIVSIEDIFWKLGFPVGIGTDSLEKHKEFQRLRMTLLRDAMRSDPTIKAFVFCIIRGQQPPQEVLNRFSNPKVSATLEKFFREINIIDKHVNNLINNEELEALIGSDFRTGRMREYIAAIEKAIEEGSLQKKGTATIVNPGAIEHANRPFQPYFFLPLELDNLD